MRTANKILLPLKFKTELKRQSSNQSFFIAALTVSSNRLAMHCDRVLNLKSSKSGANYKVFIGFFY